MLPFKGAYIAGEFIEPVLRGTPLVKLDPGNTDRKIGAWSSQTEMVNPSVESARHAFESWAWIEDKEKFKYFHKLKQALQKKRKQLAEMISSEAGKMLFESEAEVDTAINKIDITLAEGIQLVRAAEKDSPKEYYNFHPRGVLAVIGPFNFPLQLPLAHIIPALATGNTVVFKPSELTPFTGQLIAEIFHQCNFPKGVFNLVPGNGEVGHLLANHAGIDGVLFTGSDTVGRKIQRDVLKDPHKICALEMGGKNAVIVFDAVDLPKTADDCVASAFTSAGQRCNAASRLFIHKKILPDFIPLLIERTKSWKVGYFKKSSAQMGPLVSQKAVERFLEYQNKAVIEGARILLTGKRLKLEHPGYYVSPSLHLFEKVKVKEDKTGYRYDEIFGPDLALYSFDTAEEAINLHNDSRYGLVASVYTAKKELFDEMYRKLEVGILCRNRPTIGASARLPFGGVKASGNHWPAGLFSPYYCTYPVSVIIG